METTKVGKDEIEYDGTSLKVSHKYEDGGPKEYYEKESAELVNPYDVDNIGKAILRALENHHAQPQLRNTLINKYNVSTCVDKLVAYYQQLSNK